MIFDVLVFVFVLGLLVFFHEMGHFLAAKLCNVYVDRFSLGMPPRAFGRRIGETDYCIGWLPIGGYVKMAGQEDAPLSEEERDATYGSVPPERWFNNKTVAQRAFITVAGPAMNFVLAILLYGIIAAVGAEVPASEVDNRIGMIDPDSPAAAAPMFAMGPEGQADTSAAPDAVGWQTGDRIVSIDGERIQSITDVAINAVLSRGQTVDVVVERIDDSGQVRTFLSPVEPLLRGDAKHASFGITAYDTALVDEVLEGGPAAEHGLQKGDIILRADGRGVDQLTFRKLVETWPPGTPLRIEVKRGESMVPFEMIPKTVGRFVGVVIGRNEPQDGEESAEPAEGGEPAPPAELMVYDVPAALAKDQTLLPGDIIQAIDGQPATSELLDEIEESRAGEAIALTIHRPKVLMGVARAAEDKEVTLTLEPVGVIGVRFGTLMEFHRFTVLQAIPEGFRQGYLALERTIRTVIELLRGKLSPKELGGPVLIYQATTTAAEMGYWYLFRWTAFISANLCVFNLLPLPVLDGGLLMYLGVEAIRRKPLDMRVLERIQQVGLVLIIGLLLFVTFNDISRWIASQLQ